MLRENMNDLLSFLVVAREKSFTKAAAQLGVSQSALSHTVRNLEQRLGVRLLTRTTRSVSPTDAGERMLERLVPMFEELEIELEGLSEFREKPAGTIRITATDFAIKYALWPRLTPFMREFPDIKVELVENYGLTDIVADRCDAGVRMGDQVAKDMISVRISPDFRFSVVASPEYFAERTIPQTPTELVSHRCINLRLPTHGGLYAWEFERGEEELRVRVEGQLICNTIYQVLDGALEGLGVAHMPEPMVTEHLASGRLVEVLTEWCPPWTGYHIYYPSRRQGSTAFAKLVDALRYRT